MAVQTSTQPVEQQTNVQTPQPVKGNVPVPVANPAPASVQQQVVQQPSESILKKWWFWLLVGIVVVGGVSLIFLI